MCIYIYILWGYIYIILYIYTRHIYISHKAQMQSELFRTWMVRDIDGYRWSCRAMEVSPIFDWSWIWHNEAQGVPPFCCKPVMTCTAKWPVKVGKSASCVLNGLHPRPSTWAMAKRWIVYPHWRMFRGPLVTLVILYNRDSYTTIRMFQLGWMTMNHIPRFDPSTHVSTL